MISFGYGMMHISDFVADEASPELGEIRRKKRATDNKIKDIIQKYVSGQSKYLQENIVTTRGGRFVIPVKAEYRNEVKGLIHDTSQSGATLFIEPMAVVEANNELRVLENKEQREFYILTKMGITNLLEYVTDNIGTDYIKSLLIDNELAKKCEFDSDIIIEQVALAINSGEVLDTEFKLEYNRDPISSISTRLKRTESIMDKLERKGLPFTLAAIEEHIHDMAGIRVICSYIDDIYLIADALLRQDDITLIEQKDYIKNPKANGYRSYHMIVEVPVFFANRRQNMKVEVQLRTIAMDFWASLEHQLRYKKDAEFTEEMANELYECAKMSADLDIRMEKVRKGIKNNS